MKDKVRKTYGGNSRSILQKLYPGLLDRIDSLMELGKPINIAIDGNSGAGKSTLANILGGIYDANIFHMDDFFLTPDLRTEERLREVGGNVDYVRFKRGYRRTNNWTGVQISSIKLSDHGLGRIRNSCPQTVKYN